MRRHPLADGNGFAEGFRARSVSAAPHSVAVMTVIEPFELHVADEVLDDVRARLARTRLLSTRRESRRRA